MISAANSHQMLFKAVSGTNNDKESHSSNLTNEWTSFLHHSDTGCSSFLEYYLGERRRKHVLYQSQRTDPAPKQLMVYPSLIC